MHTGCRAVHQCLVRRVCLWPQGPLPFCPAHLPYPGQLERAPSRYAEQAWTTDPRLARIERVWLPIGAAKLNRMADRWSDLQLEAIDNNSFHDRAHILEAMAAYEACWNGPRKAIMG